MSQTTMTDDLERAEEQGFPGLSQIEVWGRRA